MIKTVLLSSLIVMALVVIIHEQQVKAQSEQDKIDALTQQIKDIGADMHKTLTDDLAKLRSCHGAENAMKCKMNIMGWSDKDAIFALQLNNKSEVKK